MIWTYTCFRVGRNPQRDLPYNNVIVITIPVLPFCPFRHLEASTTRVQPPASRNIYDKISAWINWKGQKKTFWETLIHIRGSIINIKQNVPVSWTSSRSWAIKEQNCLFHYNDVIMCAMASQITSLMIVYSSVFSCADQRKQQNSASLAFLRGIHRWPVNSPAQL